METNNGIIVNGGSFTSETTAAGNNNTINVTTTHQHADLQQLSSLIDVLLGKLQAASDNEVPHKAAVLKAVNELKEEVKKPEPEKSKLEGLGKKVLGSLTFVNTLLPLAQGIWNHISSFIGIVAGV